MAVPAEEFNLPAVLVTPKDLQALSDDVRFGLSLYVSELAPVLEEKRSLGEDAVSGAVSHLLTESGIVLVHVDETKPYKSYPMSEEDPLYNPSEKLAIGFNDHCGGSDSNFKLLLNGSPDGDEASYVLYSPPDQDGDPTNTTFRRADFTFLNREAEGPYETFGYVPNPLKTSSARSYRGQVGHHFYLFGGPDIPTQVYGEFQRAGFDFFQEPYNGDIRAPEGTETTFTLGAYENAARRRLGYRGMQFWPGDQFATQLRNLGLEPPKLRAEDYPLVKSENKL